MQRTQEKNCNLQWHPLHFLHHSEVSKLDQGSFQASNEVSIQGRQQLGLSRVLLVGYCFWIVRTVWSFCSSLTATLLTQYSTLASTLSPASYLHKTHSGCFFKDLCASVVVTLSKNCYMDIKTGQ